MAIAGPRLDRPSAVGDDGRPRAASLWIATLVVVGVVGVVGYFVGEPRLLPSLALLVGPAVAGVALLERKSFGRLFVGHLLLVTFGAALSVLLVVGPFLDRSLFVAAACALALTGVAVAWADVRSGDLERAVRGAGRTYAAMLASALGVVAVGMVAVVSVVVFDEIVAASGPLWSAVGFLGVAAAVAVAGGVALRYLPIRRLARRSRRERVERRVAATRRGLRGVALGTAALAGVLAAATYLTDLDDAIADRPLLEGALEALSSEAVLVALVAVGVAALLAALLAAALRRFARQFDGESTRNEVAVVTGVVVTVVGAVWAALLLLGVIRGVPSLVDRLSTAGAPIGMLVLVGPLALLLVGGVGVFADGMGLLPARATGPAVAATGLLLAAIALGAGRPALTFACIAGAGLVWDVSTFGLGLTAELGHLPETRRLELFHGTVAVGIAVGAVAVALGLETLRTGLFVGIGGTVGAVVTALGALLLLIPLRG